MAPSTLPSVLKHHLHARDDTSPGIVALYIILGAVIALVVSCVLQWGWAQHHHFYSFRQRRRRVVTPLSGLSASGFRYAGRYERRRRGSNSTPGGAMPLDGLDAEREDVTRPGNVHLRYRRHRLRRPGALRRAPRRLHHHHHPVSTSPTPSPALNRRPVYVQERARSHEEQAQDDSHRDADLDVGVLGRAARELSLDEARGDLTAGDGA
ncbi:hypothetical protein E4U55_007994 [Claviceps digitariae]|nr:hypothetical protein E4U55_007994 [Claviceps digitariae]